MRLISLLLALVILGYVIKLYLDSSSVTATDDKVTTSHPQKTLERVEQTADQLNRVLQDQQHRINNKDQ
jgi:hypothetical protein